MTTIQTVGTKLFDVLNPDPKDISIEEIAHALSNLCRFSGHTVGFYSVAQHSVLAYRLARKRGDAKLALAALLHDASEAYIGDVSRPLKQLLGTAYTHLEHNLMDAIAQKYQFDWPMNEQVKQIDNDLLETEFSKVMGGKHLSISKLGEHCTDDCLDFAEWSPRKAKREFLEAFDNLTSQGELFDYGVQLKIALQGRDEVMAQPNPPAHTRGKDAYFRSLNDGTR